MNDALEQKKLVLHFLRDLHSSQLPQETPLSEEAKLPGFLHLDDRSQGKKVPQTEEATAECPHELCCPQMFSGAIAVVRQPDKGPGEAGKMPHRESGSLLKEKGEEGVETYIT